MCTPIESACLSLTLFNFLCCPQSISIEFWSSTSARSQRRWVTFYLKSLLKSFRWWTLHLVHKQEWKLVILVILPWRINIKLQWSCSAHRLSSVSLQGLYMIRFHSFYPWHSHGDYMHLCNDKDLSMIPWVQEFKWVSSHFIFKWSVSQFWPDAGLSYPVHSKFDLYTKTTDMPDVDKLKSYYQSLIDKYCPGILKWWNRRPRSQWWKRYALYNTIAGLIVVTEYILSNCIFYIVHAEKF